MSFRQEGEARPVTIGQTIAAARSARGLTVAQVSDVTRIRPSVLQAIENDDFIPCGGDFYARGHLRTIAGVLGLEPEPLLAQYDESHSSPSHTPMAKAFETEARGSRTGRSGPNWTTAMAVALVVIAVVGVLRVLGGGDDPVPPAQASGPLTPTVTSPRPERPEPRAQPSTTLSRAAAPTASTSASPTVSGRVTVVMSAVDSSWVSAEAGGEVLFEGTLEAGESQTWTDGEQVSVVVGDADAIALTVNGEDIGAPGDDGEVLELDFGPGDPT
jgi:cytoskeletal protein RodZ